MSGFSFLKVLNRTFIYASRMRGTTFVFQNNQSPHIKSCIISIKIFARIVFRIKIKFICTFLNLYIDLSFTII